MKAPRYGDLITVTQRDRNGDEYQVTMEYRPWTETLYAQLDPPRPLTLPELQRLHRAGFPELAARLAAGTCPDCGLNKLGRGHRDICLTGVKRPQPAPPSVRQPWVPKRSHRAA